MKPRPVRVFGGGRIRHEGRWIWLVVAAPFLVGATIYVVAMVLRRLGVVVL
jgi:hypothetical protein